MISALIIRDVRRAFVGGAWLPIAFFLLVATLVPFAVGPDARLLGRIGAGALWIAALTAALLPIERLIEPDRADGILDQLALHGAAEESVAAAKIAAHWLTFAPLLLIAAVPASALLGDGWSRARARRARARGRDARAGRAGGRGGGGHRRAAAGRIACRIAPAAAGGAAADLRRGGERRGRSGALAARRRDVAAA